MIKKYSLFIICLIALNAQEELSENNYKIPKITIEGSKKAAYTIGGGSKITQELLSEFPSGNGQITNFLKINPNVVFSNQVNSSKTPGEIDPANVSINGAMFYQNLFNLDGVSMNNDLNPQATNPASPTSIPGRSQGLAIDASLIGSIQVLDSNISAAYGGFEGGVIEATTKDPSKEFKAKISYQLTSSKLTAYHIYPSEYASFINSSSSTSQPEFFKYLVRAQAEGYIGKDFGIIGSFATTQSTIPLHLYAQSAAKEDKKDNKRSLFNYFLKGLYTGIEDLRLEASLTYAPQNNQYFIVNSRDSQYSILSGGLQALLKTTYNFKIAQTINALSYNDESNSRKGQEQYYKVWKTSADKDWGTAKQSNEGTWGNLNSGQRRLEFKDDTHFEELSFSKTHHNLSAGIQLSYTNAYYMRPNDFFTADATPGSQKPLKAGETCQETQYCSSSPVNDMATTWKDNKGQYFAKLTTYQKGTIKLDNFAYGGYIEDSIQFWHLHFRPGVRFDGDTYMKKFTIAPRVALELDVFGDKKTRLIGGYNRYYGRNILNFRLQDGINALIATQTRTAPDKPWSAGVVAKSKTKFEELKIPYNDEFVAGISQKVWKFEGSFKYVHRNGRDGITKVIHTPKINPAPDSNYDDKLYYTYANDGKSDSDIFSLSIGTTEPIHFLNIYQHFLFTADYSKIRRNFVDYDSTNIFDEDVMFDGKIIKHSALPPDNFAKPWNTRITTITDIRFSRTTLTWSNFFSYRSSYQKALNIGTSTSKGSDGKALKEYTIFNFPNAFTWDTRIGFDVRFWGKNTLFINLDIYNLLDNLNISTANFTTIKGQTTITPTYETGRSFWLQAGYQF
ncbi:hypothetical protein BKH46_02825 [Helicobacter sp. 12S02634-8]|uniref:TonB-dependent receptor plug domain-containing protein n=1 Tax=Helicobacter sp. 12S02634-8 TaxID=1476199 RepID=UPI000BA68612|nr:TonB-dependent receptor plug domain-containing protein [Helicobacter sp. 12S02634-8]PAF47786.1 hypothetical protein BKH46_02825 [Helicobacter sp. 12S02634-8]